MLNIIKNNFFLFILLLFSFLFVNNLDIKAFGHASDRLTLSAPSASSSHIITMRAAKNIPPNGKIVFTPESGFFTIEDNFDYSDVDIATSSSSNGPFIDRMVAATSSATSDGVSAVASSTTGNVTITLNSSYGIDIGDYVRLELGPVASFATSGDRYIINPIATGTYDIEVVAYDENDNYLERAGLKVAIVESVSMTVDMGKLRSHGSPSGWLAYGTTQTLMSLNTNYVANCRYITTPDTPYNLMVNDFSNTGNYFHSVLLTGLTNGTTYNFYIRCRDDENVDDTTDYLINFSISGQDKRNR